MKNNRGAALILALSLLFIISLLVSAYLQLAATDLQISNNHYLRTQALYIAEAGLEYGVRQLKTSKSNFSSGNISFPSGSGHFYNVTYSSSSSKITSTGTLASGEHVTLEAKAAVTGAGSPYTVKILDWRVI